MKIKQKSSSVFIAMISLLKFVLNERIPLHCDEFGTESVLYDGLYCTVNDIHLNSGDSFDCDVYPRYRQLVRMVKFTNSRAPFVPFMLFQYFDGIREFDMSSTELESLRHDDFYKAENLMYLTVSHNKLMELTVSLFIGAPNISVCDFSYNFIYKIHPDTFTGAIMISRLHLSHNSLKTLDKGTFKSLSSLDELWLDNNQIEHIDGELFMYSQVLARLSLSNNKIVLIDCSVFSHLHYLFRIDLSNNRLNEFNTDCISGSHYDLIVHDNQLKNLTLQRVTSVHASRNRIEYIFIGDDVGNLKMLKLANNSLKNITDIFMLSSLETIDLSYNYVGRLNISTFAKLTNLEHLHLSHTNLSNINFGTFFHQKQLKILDISYNNLKRINFDVFLPYLKNLESLFLDGNQLKDLEGLSNQLFPQLAVLGISNNNFNCSYLVKMVTALKWEELPSSLDQDIVHSNETHVNGITCNHLTNDTTLENHNAITYNRISDDGYDNRNVHKAIQALLKPNIVSKTNTNASNETADINDREHILEMHLLTMKYLLVIICLTCLIFIVIKILILYRANRQFEFNVTPAPIGIYLQESDKHDIYQSTATMNTFQTNAY